MQRARTEDAPCTPRPWTASFLVPAPFTGSDSPEFWSALVIDYASIAATWTALGLFRTIPHAYSNNAPPILPFLGAGFLFAVIFTLHGFSEGLYQDRDSRSNVAVVIKSGLWTMLLVLVGIRFTGQSGLSITSVGAGGVLTLVALVAARRWRAVIPQYRKHDTLRNVLVVGTTLAARQVAAHIGRHPELRRIVRCCLDQDHVEARDLQALGERIATLARSEFVDEVIIAAPVHPALAQAVIREAQRNHLDVRMLPDLYGFGVQAHRIERVGTSPLLTLHEERIPAAGLLLKRVLDMAVSACALLATTPVMLVIASLVKVDSPGPALFSALRVGRKGRRFRCHKFRTMVANAEDAKEKLRANNQREGPTFKIVDDPRITRVGRWLRRYSLDELPQLWNVFTGEMSLVGPRPHPVDDCARYELEHLRRLDVTPGITGLWQITARRNASFQTNMALDLEYIEKWNLWMDLRILLRTVAVVFQGTGS